MDAPASGADMSLGDEGASDKDLDEPRADPGSGEPDEKYSFYFKNVREEATSLMHVMTQLPTTIV